MNLDELIAEALGRTDLEPDDYALLRAEWLTRGLRLPRLPKEAK